MLKKVLALTCTAVLITASMAGCGSDKDKKEENDNTAATTYYISDPEAARVSTLDKFLKSRSITIDEKVLRFYLDHAQMEYNNFTVKDTSKIEAIAPGETVTNIEYTNDNGLTAYVDMKNRSDEVLGYKKNKVKINKIRLIKGKSKSQLHLPNKLGWDTPIDQFKKNYGTPLSEKTDENGNTIITYGEEVPEIQEGYTMELVFENGILIEFTIEMHDAL